MIYLDNAASTAVHPEVVKEMMPYFDIQYGNPSSIHQFGRKAKNAIQKARKQVAVLIGAEPDEITFTSGGTESNNTIFYGIKFQGEKSEPSHIIILISKQNNAVADFTQVEYEEIAVGPDYRTIRIPLEEGDRWIEVIGTYVIPEFGSMVIIILVIAVSSAIIMSKSKLSVRYN